MQALEASYVSRVSGQPASLCVECVDASRVRHALATLGNGNGDPGLRAAATGKPAYMPVTDLAIHGTAGEADVSEEDPLRVLVDARKHELPAVARFLRVEPMSADERRWLPRSSCATVHLHAAYDESLLRGGDVGYPWCRPSNSTWTSRRTPRTSAPVTKKMPGTCGSRRSRPSTRIDFQGVVLPGMRFTAAGKPTEHNNRALRMPPTARLPERKELCDDRDTRQQKEYARTIRKRKPVPTRPQIRPIVTLLEEVTAPD